MEYDKLVSQPIRNTCMMYHVRHEDMSGTSVSFDFVYVKYIS